MLYLFVFLMGLVIGLDQWSKHLVRVSLPLGYFENIHVLSDYFQITHIENSGIAFGLHFPGIQYLSYFAFIVVIFVLYKIVEKEHLSFLGKLSFALIIGGATGNLIDRLFLGSVTDMIMLGYNNHYFPVFNIADTAVTMGIIIYILSSGIIKNQFRNVA